MDNIKILYVEDEAMVMKVTKMMFNKIGIKPDCVCNATDALKLVEQTQYDLILLDLGLPDIDGIRLSFQIRKYERRYRMQRSKIFAITAYDLKNVERLCISAGMNGVFNKPLKIDLLKDLIGDITPIACM
jgi:CheY-like chemotaxis protein